MFSVYELKDHFKNIQSEIDQKLVSVKSKPEAFAELYIPLSQKFLKYLNNYLKIINTNQQLGQTISKIVENFNSLISNYKERTLNFLSRSNIDNLSFNRISQEIDQENQLDEINSFMNNRNKNLPVLCDGNISNFDKEKQRRDLADFVNSIQLKVSKVKQAKKSLLIPSDGINRSKIMRKCTFDVSFVNQSSEHEIQNEKSRQEKESIGTIRQEVEQQNNVFDQSETFDIETQTENFTQISFQEEEIEPQLIKTQQNQSEKEDIKSINQTRSKSKKKVKSSKNKSKSKNNNITKMKTVKSLNQRQLQRRKNIQINQIYQLQINRIEEKKQEQTSKFLEVDNNIQRQQVIDKVQKSVQIRQKYAIQQAFSYCVFSFDKHQQKINSNSLSSGEVSLMIKKYLPRSSKISLQQKVLPSLRIDKRDLTVHKISKNELYQVSHQNQILQISKKDHLKYFSIDPIIENEITPLNSLKYFSKKQSVPEKLDSIHQNFKNELSEKKSIQNERVIHKQKSSQSLFNNSEYNNRTSQQSVSANSDYDKIYSNTNAKLDPRRSDQKLDANKFIERKTRRKGNFYYSNKFNEITPINQIPFNERQNLDSFNQLKTKKKQKSLLQNPKLSSLLDLREIKNSQPFDTFQAKQNIVFENLKIAENINSNPFSQLSNYLKRDTEKNSSTVNKYSTLNNTLDTFNSKSCKIKKNKISHQKYESEKLNQKAGQLKKKRIKGKIEYYSLKESPRKVNDNPTNQKHPDFSKIMRNKMSRIKFKQYMDLLELTHLQFCGANCAHIQSFKQEISQKQPFGSHLFKLMKQSN